MPPVHQTAEAGVMVPKENKVFDQNEVEKILINHGFKKDHQSGFGESYKIDLGNNWKVSIYCSFVGNPFQGDVNKSQYEAVSASLHDSIGTRYKFTSCIALDKNIDGIVETLKEQSDNDEILKCEKCKIRYGHPKEPPPGKKWKPFLSCEGMIITGKGQNKHVICDGVSKKLPAVVIV